MGFRGFRKLLYLTISISHGICDFACRTVIVFQDSRQIYKSLKHIVKLRPCITSGVRLCIWLLFFFRHRMPDLFDPCIHHVGKFITPQCILSDIGMEYRIVCPFFVIYLRLYLNVINIRSLINLGLVNLRLFNLRFPYFRFFNLLFLNLRLFILRFFSFRIFNFLFLNLRLFNLWLFSLWLFNLRFLCCGL